MDRRDGAGENGDWLRRRLAVPVPFFALARKKTANLRIFIADFGVFGALRRLTEDVIGSQSPVSPDSRKEDAGLSGAGTRREKTRLRPELAEGLRCGKPFWKNKATGVVIGSRPQVPMHIEAAGK